MRRCQIQRIPVKFNSAYNTLKKISPVRRLDRLRSRRDGYVPPRLQTVKVPARTQTSAQTMRTQLPVGVPLVNTVCDLCFYDSQYHLSLPHCFPFASNFPSAYHGKFIRLELNVHAEYQMHDAESICSANTRTNLVCLLTLEKLVPHTCETLYLFVYFHLLNDAVSR